MAGFRENPLQAAASGVSMIVGAGLGAGFTLVSSNWLFQSALPAWGVKKVSDNFTNYLTNQEELISKGELSEAEAEKVKFEKDIVKYVGAPLMGAFSCAAGAMMWAQIFNPPKRSPVHRSAGFLAAIRSSKESGFLGMELFV